MGALAPVVPPGSRGTGARAPRGGQGRPEPLWDIRGAEPARKRGYAVPQLHTRVEGTESPLRVKSRAPHRRTRDGLPRTFRKTTGGLGESWSPFDVFRHWAVQDGPLERCAAARGAREGSGPRSPLPRARPLAAPAWETLSSTRPCEPLGGGTNHKVKQSNWPNG